VRQKALNSVYELAKNDKRVVFIGSDLGPGVLNEMKENLPDRFFMEGVSEQHVVGMAAGLAMEGFVPYVNTIATFLTRRCYEQVVLDLCLQDIPVRLIANGGGLVYAPLGPTHLAIEDIAIMRCLPNMTIVAPCDADEMERFMSQTTQWPHPIYIRLAKGYDKVISTEAGGFEIGKAILMNEYVDGVFVTTGVMTQIALEAADILKQKGIQCGVLHMHTIKPLDIDSIRECISKVGSLVTVEEHMRTGGLGSAILEYCNDECPEHVHKISRVGLPDRFPDKYGSQDSLLEHMGISVEHLCEVMARKLKN
jgi:transketolase